MNREVTRVAESTGSPPAGGSPGEARPSRERRRRAWAPPAAVVAAIVRAVTVTGALGVVFAIAPLESQAAQVAQRLGLALVILAVVVSVQIVAVARSGYPVVRGAEALAVSLALLLFAFASTYYAIDQSSPGSFNEELTRADAAYFTVTVFATVGFGDVVATSQSARLTVTAQMVVNMVMIGVIARVLFGTVQQRRAALRHGAPDTPGEVERDR